MSDVKVLSWYAPRDLFRALDRKTDKEQCHNDLGRNVRPKKRSSEVNYLDSPNYVYTTSFLHRQKIKKRQTRLTNDSDLSNDSTTRWNSVQKLFSKLQSSLLSLTFQSNRTRNPSSLLSSYGTLQHGFIGEGVSASVHLITKENQVLAVKIFKRPKKRELSNGYMKSLAGEFCISSALNHPNILKAVDFVQMDEDPERYCIVMEYCSQGDIYGLIKQGNLQPLDIYGYFKQLLFGLDYIHSLGVAHRDLKPENLLIRNNVLKIADFGSADVFRVAWQDHSRLSDGLCGTTPYMAPEVFGNGGYWAAPIDVWSAGIIFFCMLFDGVPFGCARKSDTNYPIYLRKRPLFQYDPFNVLGMDQRKLLYVMLDPDSNSRITISQVLNIPWIENIHVDQSTYI